MSNALCTVSCAPFGEELDSDPDGGSVASPNLPFLSLACEISLDRLQPTLEHYLHPLSSPSNVHASGAAVFETARCDHKGLPSTDRVGICIGFVLAAWGLGGIALQRGEFTTAQASCLLGRSQIKRRVERSSKLGLVAVWAGCSITSGPICNPRSLSLSSWAMWAIYQLIRRFPHLVQNQYSDAVLESQAFA